MPLRSWLARAAALPGAPGLSVLTAGREEWLRMGQDFAAAGARLLSLWADREAENGGARVYALLLVPGGACLAVLPLPDAGLHYPGLETVFPAAGRLQRAAADLCGVHPAASDRRPWLRHAAWPADFVPLSGQDPAVAGASPGTAAADAYAFVRVAGDGVHEIPVGPVHAGTIEPGHFRFTVVGEKVLRLEERLGYVHKGIERRFTELPLLEGHRLAARVSGDAAVAFSWAYCRALETMTDCEIGARAAWLRALGLELERIANHLGDLGALGNDAGFAFGLAQFSRLKEQLLRATAAALGARYLMDFIVPGGTRADIASGGASTLRECVRDVAQQARELRSIYDDHAGLRDRFTGAGTVSPELAVRLGLLGLAGRASGQAADLRTDLPCAPYDVIRVAPCTRQEGDVAARVAVRFDELQASCGLVILLLDGLPQGAHRATAAVPADGSLGIGLIEGWRGPVMVALEAGPAGTIRRCHPHDPSWQNWPVLEHAIIGNIVPDFPLINKSFNLSYSGHDL